MKLSKQEELKWRRGKKRTPEEMGKLLKLIREDTAKVKSIIKKLEEL